MLHFLHNFFYNYKHYIHLHTDEKHLFHAFCLIVMVVLCAVVFLTKRFLGKTIDIAKLCVFGLVLIGGVFLLQHLITDIFALAVVLFGALLFLISRGLQWFSDTPETQKPYWHGALVGGIILSAVAFCSDYLYHRMEHVLLDTTQKHLLGLAQSAANMTDGDLHQTLTLPKQKDSEAYRRVQEPYRTLLHANPEIAFIYTVIERNGKFYFITDTKQTGSGEDDTAEIMEHYDDISEHMVRAIRSEKSDVTDEPYTDKWGTFLSAYAPIFDSSRNYIGIVGVDIRLDDFKQKLISMKTGYILIILVGLASSILAGWIVARLEKERLNGQQALRSSEVRFRNIANTMPCFLYMFGRDNRVDFINHTFRKFLNVSLQDIPTRMDEYIHPEDRIYYQNRLQDAVTGQKPIQVWYRLKRQDGEYRWILDSCVPRYGIDQTLEGYICTGMDVTEQRQALEAIQQERQFVRSILDAIPNPIFVTDANEQWKSSNHAFDTMTGNQRQPYIDASLAHYHAQQNRNHHAITRDSLPDSARTTFEETIQTAAGEHKVVATTISHLRLANLSAGIVGVIHDITERKRYEEELKAHRDNLQQLVDEKTKDVMAQKEAAEKASQAKSEFLSNMSHELRTPMHAVINYASMGLKQGRNTDPEKIEKYLNNIIKASTRLLGLLNNMLDLAKMESGKLKFTLKESDFHSVVQHALMETDSLSSAKQLRMHYQINCDNTLAYFDATYMIQVLINLLSNAIKFTPVHSTILIEVSDTCLLSGEDALACRIMDEGTGIPQGELETIFDKFIQSSKTRTGAGGTGLGLSICREIMDAHHGRIWAENRQDRSGACFTFILPRRMKTEVRI